MQNSFNDLTDLAGKQGVIVKHFCTWCPNEKTGDLQVWVDGEIVPLPCCLDCARLIAERHKEKFEGLPPQD